MGLPSKSVVNWLPSDFLAPLLNIPPFVSTLFDSKLSYLFFIGKSAFIDYWSLLFVSVTLVELRSLALIPLARLYYASLRCRFLSWTSFFSLCSSTFLAVELSSLKRSTTDGLERSTGIPNPVSLFLIWLTLPLIAILSPFVNFFGLIYPEPVITSVSSSCYYF